MSAFLKQSTSIGVAIGPFVDSTDGNTVEDGLTITQPDIRLKKNGGNWAQKAAAQTLTHEEAGWYEVTLDTTDTDTLGILMVAIHESGALPVWREFMVVTANVYDTLFSTDVFDTSITQLLGTAIATPTTGGVLEVDLTHIAGSAVSTSTAQLGVNTVQAAGTAWGSGAITAASIATDAITATKIAADAIGASELAADAVDEILDDTIGDSTITVRQALRIFVAALAGKASGGATSTMIYRNVADSADRITATVDANGNRTAVTLSL